MFSVDSKTRVCLKEQCNCYKTKKEKIIYLYTHNDLYCPISLISQICDASSSEVSQCIGSNGLTRSWNAVREHQKEILLESLYNQGITPELRAQKLKEGLDANTLIFDKKGKTIADSPDHQARIKYLRLISEIDGTVQHADKQGVTVNVGISFDRITKMSDDELDKEISTLQDSAKDAKAERMPNTEIPPNTATKPQE